MTQFNEMITPSTKWIKKGKRNWMGRNSEGILQGTKHSAGPVEGSRDVVLISNSSRFYSKSLSAFMSAAESVEHSRIFSSSQRADFVFCKRR